MFSLGQASFMAIGAYGAGVLAVSWGIPFPIAAGAGIVLSSVTAFLVGLPTIRLRRDYIALVTFGFGEAIIAILNNTVQITGGAMGLMGIPMLTTFPLAFRVGGGRRRSSVELQAFPFRAAMPGAQDRRISRPIYGDRRGSAKNDRLRVFRRGDRVRRGPLRILHQLRRAEQL